MSFAKRRQLIEEGDVVILYLGINRMLKLDVIQHTLSKKNQVIENVVQTQYGAIKPYSLVGKPFGSKVQLTKGWGHILCPTPELWTHVVPHRTQILYAPDISFILMNLEIQPGSIVIEAGTGSGSLSHAFINAIKTKGHLYTFDFHEIRAKTAREEFHQHGLGEWVSVDHRDVGAEGFGEKLLQKADAVFLDLPNPWNVIEHALVSLKLGGRICTFSPCVEQVQRTVQKLNKLGFEEVTTVEIIQTEKGVHRRMNNTLDLNIVKVERIDEEVQRSSTARNRAPAASEVVEKQRPVIPQNPVRPIPQPLAQLKHPKISPACTPPLTTVTVPPALPSSNLAMPSGSLDFIRGGEFLIETPRYGEVTFIRPYNVQRKVQPPGRPKTRNLPNEAEGNSTQVMYCNRKLEPARPLNPSANVTTSRPNMTVHERAPVEIPIRPRPIAPVPGPSSYYSPEFDNTWQAIKTVVSPDQIVYSTAGKLIITPRRKLKTGPEQFIHRQPILLPDPIPINKGFVFKCPNTPVHKFDASSSQLNVEPSIPPYIPRRARSTIRGQPPGQGQFTFMPQAIASVVPKRPLGHFFETSLCEDPLGLNDDDIDDVEDKTHSSILHSTPMRRSCTATEVSPFAEIQSPLGLEELHQEFSVDFSTPVYSKYENGKSGSGTGISNTVTSNPSSQTGHSGYLTFGLVGDRALMEATNILFREFKNARPTPPTEIFDDGHTSFQDFIKKTNETQFPNI